MNWWQAIMRAADQRAVERDARRLESIAGSMKGLGDQVSAIHQAVTDLTTELRSVQRQTDRLIALRVEDADAAARMVRLEQVLEAGRIVSHVSAAVARAELADAPVPHLIVSNVLPDDVYRVIVDAIPPSVFFDSSAENRQELSLPLTLAPTHSIAAWAFVTNVLRKALGPAILTRFEERLQQSGASLTASRGRIALRRPGDVIPEDRRRTAHVLTTIVPLIASGGGEDHVNLLLRRHGQGSSAFPTGSSTPAAGQTIALPANSALTFVTLTGALVYEAVPARGATASGLYTWEFPIG